MGRPPRFNISEIEDAVVAVLDRQGAAGLTIRAVARELGTGAMTLYNYVDDPATLQALAVDSVLRAVMPLPAPSDDWRADVMAIAEAVWRAVRAHPHAIPLILARRSQSPIFLQTAERLLAALAGSGRRDADLLTAFRAVTTLATSFAMTELAGSVGVGREDPDVVIDRFRMLPQEQYPHLIEIAQAATTSEPEVEFRTGLAALLDGLAG